MDRPTSTATTTNTTSRPQTADATAILGRTRPGTRTRSTRNKAPARWAVVGLTALAFGGFWSAVSPDSIVAATASPAEAALDTTATTVNPAAVTAAGAERAAAGIGATQSAPAATATALPATATATAAKTTTGTTTTTTTTTTSTARLRTRGS